MVSFNSVSVSSFSVNPGVTLPLNIGLNGSSMSGLPSPAQMLGGAMMGDAFMRGVGAGAALGGMGMGGMPGMGHAAGFAKGFMAAQQMNAMQNLAKQMSGKQGCKKKKKKKCCKCKNNAMQQNQLPFMNPMMNPMMNPAMALGNTLRNFTGAAFAAGAQFGSTMAALNPLNSLMGGCGSLLSGFSGSVGSMSMTSISSVSYA
jgi:hypothetical protein